MVSPDLGNGTIGSPVKKNIRIKKRRPSVEIPTIVKAMAHRYFPKPVRENTPAGMRSSRAIAFGSAIDIKFVRRTARYGVFG
jgi:hypothetical protein